MLTKSKIRIELIQSILSSKVVRRVLLRPVSSLAYILDLHSEIFCKTAMEAIRKRRNVLFERMKWELSNVSAVEKRKPPVGEVQESMHKLPELCEQFDKVQSEIEDQTEAIGEISSIFNHRLEFEELYHQVKGRYMKLLEEHNPHGSSEGTIVEPADDLREAIRLLLDSQRILMTSQAAASNNVSQLAGQIGSVSLSHPVADAQASGGQIPLEVLLPTIALPVFKGDRKHWTSFKDLFESCINSKNLKNSVKLQYLLSHLDGEAKKLVSSCIITDANYVDGSMGEAERVL